VEGRPGQEDEHEREDDEQRTNADQRPARPATEQGDAQQDEGDPPGCLEELGLEVNAVPAVDAQARMGQVFLWKITVSVVRQIINVGIATSRPMAASAHR